MFDRIIPQKVTMFLLFTNVIIFFVMFFTNWFIMSPNPNVDFYHYIMIKMSIYKGSPFWSIITSAFVHGGIIHVSMNMLGLFIFGNIVEYNIKKKDFILLYFVSLLLSSIFSIIYVTFFSSNPYSFVVGASGAIFGLWAFYSMLFNKFNEFSIYFIAYHVLIFVLNMSIAWYSHIGGAIAGILFWFLYYNKKEKNRGVLKWN